MVIGFLIDINFVILNVNIYNDLNNDENLCKVFYGVENRIEVIKKSEEFRREGFIVELLLIENINEIKIIKGGEK